MKYLSKYIVLVLVLFASCIDPIDFEVPAGLGESFVVQGRIVKSDQSFVEVLVTRLFDFSPESRIPVSVRKVVLIDSKGGEMELDAFDQGQYRQLLDPSTLIQATVGTGYKIRVETFNGRTFESEMDIMLGVGQPTDLNVSIQSVLRPDINGNFEEQDRVRLAIDTDLNSNREGGMYWEVFERFKFTDSPTDPNIPTKTCYLNYQTADLTILDPNEVTSSSVENYGLTSKPIDFRFSEGLFYEVKQYSLSNGAFSFWRSVSELNERGGNMFDGPVGEVPTNLENTSDPDDKIFGYFFASEEALIRIKVPQALVGNPGQFCPPPVPPVSPDGSCAIGLCCNCLDDATATLQPPPFWID